jgi:hypothetical protein
MMVTRVSDFARRLLGAGDRVEGNRRKWDRDAGYAEYHAFCRSRFTRSGPAPGTPVHEGVERFRVMDPEVAARLRRRIEADYECAVVNEKSPHLLLYRIDDPSFDRELLEQVVVPALDERAVRYFGSEYVVYWYSVSRAIPCETLDRNSFRWHCDRGPEHHLKLLLYLNDHEEHGGSTEFLDLEATRRIAEGGYVFGPVKTRVTDLAPHAKRAGITYEPWSPEMKAGEGILFPPGRALHRGLLPSRGPRLVVTLCLLPSPVPWRTALDRGGLAGSTDGAKWHADASLLKRLYGGGGASDRDA